MTFNAPQIIWFVLTFLGLGVSMSKHGEPKSGENNFFVDLLCTALVLGLLYWGGFFG